MKIMNGLKVISDTRWKSREFFAFCKNFGEYYWSNVHEIPSLAKDLGWSGPIGDSTLPDNKPNLKVIEATKLLVANNGNPQEKFTAMMILVRQIRNNLFHGKKMELYEPEVYKRNKDLVRQGGEITSLLLENLEQAEHVLGFN